MSNNINPFFLTKLFENVHIGIISKGRPNNLLKEIYKSIHSQSHWYLSSQQDIEEYEEVRDELKINNDPFPTLRIGGSLCETRNTIIDDAQYLGKKYAVMMDDDISDIHFALSKTQKSKISIPHAIDHIITDLQISLGGRIKLAGTAPTANSFFYPEKEPISFTKFCGGWFLVIDTSTDLRFDTNLTLKEDYDYTLQHIQKYGGAARFNMLLVSAAHYSNKGGVVSYRNPERERQNIAYLKRKWGPEIIRDNSKRSNEILLRVKK